MDTDPELSTVLIESKSDGDGFCRCVGKQDFDDAFLASFKACFFFFLRSLFRRFLFLPFPFPSPKVLLFETSTRQKGGQGMAVTRLFAQNQSLGNKMK